MRRRGGFTVIEAVISLALSALFMLLAAQLLRDTQLVTLATRRQALDPTPAHIAQRLRRDVHRSSGTLQLLGSSGPLWSSGPMTLMLPGGGSIRYERTGERMSRRLFDGGGGAINERELLRGVVGWRWLQIGSDLVEVEIIYRRRPDAEALQRLPAVSRTSVDVLRMRMAMRAAPGKSSW